jgi:hypothetical protein
MVAQVFEVAVITGVAGNTTPFVDALVQLAVFAAVAPHSVLFIQRMDTV